MMVTVVVVASISDVPVAFFVEILPVAEKAFFHLNPFVFITIVSVVCVSPFQSFVVINVTIIDSTVGNDGYVGLL